MFLKGHGFASDVIALTIYLGQFTRAAQENCVSKKKW